MQRERVLDLFALHQSELTQLDSAPGLAFFPGFQSHRLDIASMAFGSLRDSQTIALTNAVNEFSYYTRHLMGWAAILRTLDDQERMETMLEFVHPVAHFCIGSPYAIKMRFCRSIAQLSHQANRFLLPDWTDHTEFKTNFTTAKRLAGPWISWPELEAGLSRLDSKEFRADVYDFRNESQHGFPRQLEFGQTPVVRRQISEHGSSYGYGVLEPLLIEDAVVPLQQQCSAALAVHQAYVALVCEQTELVVDACAVDG